MKIVYIAHPISGPAEQWNRLKVIEIVRYLNLTEPNILPFAPYIVDLQALNDQVPAERDRGIRNNREYFTRGMIDELRVYGPLESAGVKEEIKLAREYGIPVVRRNYPTL